MRSGISFQGMTVEVKKRPDGGYLISSRDYQQKIFLGKPIEAGEWPQIVKNEILAIIGKSAAGGNQVIFEQRSMRVVAELFEMGSDEIAIVINRPPILALPVTNDRIEIVAIRRSAELAA